MAQLIPENFDKLFFTESTFGKPFLSDGILTVPVTGVLPLEGYPFTDQGRPLSGRMIFKGVVSSSRTVTEYVGDPVRPDGFREPYEIADIEDRATDIPSREYAFEGVSENPMAWIDNWIVRAEAFEFEVEST